jgi:hypothetical protein
LPLFLAQDASPIPAWLDEVHFFAARGQHVAGVELPAAAALGLPVHGHATLGEQRLGLTAGVDDAGDLEQLTEPDHVAPDLDLAHPRLRYIGYFLRDRLTGIFLTDVRQLIRYVCTSEDSNK